MAFYRTHNSETHVSESIFDIALGVYNTGGQLYFSSVMSDNFNVTIDQLEGEINVPYQYDEEIREWTQADYDVAMGQWEESGYVTWDNRFPYGNPSDSNIKSLEKGQIPNAFGNNRPGPGMFYVNIGTNMVYEYSQDGGFNPVLYDTILPTIFNPQLHLMVRRQIIVPDSILGGFGQWRINYTYIQYPQSPGQEGTFIAGSLNTERLTVPKRIYNPDQIIVDTTFTFDKNTIREAFADKIYQSFFSSSAEMPSNFGDLKSLQTTIRDGFITTGRSEDEKLVFYKKDRNTPENIKDFNEGTLSLIVSDISGSLSDAEVTGPQNISEYLDDELTIIGPTIGDRIASDETNDSNNPLYYYETTTYELQYKNASMKIPFASYNTFYADSGATDDLYEHKLDIEWTNVFNLSQLTTPNLSGKRIDPGKARQILDTTIFELLPSQKTRQDEINEFLGILIV